MTNESTIPKVDHRNFNREGKAFDVGETFAGVEFEKGLAAVEEIKGVLPKGMTLAQMALKWILMHEEVSVVIPGAKRPSQVEDNAQASDLPPLSDSVMNKVEDIYNQYIKPDVHQRW